MTLWMTNTLLTLSTMKTPRETSDMKLPPVYEINHNTNLQTVTELNIVRIVLIDLQGIVLQTLLSHHIDHEKMPLQGQFLFYSNFSFSQNKSTLERKNEGITVNISSSSDIGTLKC